MLHQSNFLLETERNCYFIKTSSKQDEQPAVAVNPINGCKPELDMTSISNPITDDGISNLMNLNNGGIIDMDISSSRKFAADEKPDNDDDEFNIGTKSLTEATVNERQASLKLKSGHDCEEDLNSFPPFTSVKHDLSTDKDVARGDMIIETGTCISLCSPESARQVLKDLCSPESARQVLKDLLIDEGISLEDKLPVVSGCSCLAEELPKVEISMADKIHFHNLGLEIIADDLKLIAIKDKEKNPERQETSLSDGLAHIKEDDKGLLEESFDLHSSKVEEKHLCSSLVWDQNAEEHEIGSISEKCIGEGLFSNKIGSIMKILEEEAERDSKSGILSVYQKENILEVPARDCERNSGLDLNISSSTNCLDVRLQSSCTMMDDSVDSLIETTMPVPFSRDNYTSVESLDCGAGCNKCVTSYVNCAGERSEIPSHEIYPVENSALKGRNGKEKAAFPDGWMSETNKNSTLLCTVNNSPPQASPVLDSEKAKIQVVAESNFASKEPSDASIISCLSSSMGFSADLLFHGHLETSRLKPEKMEMIAGNVLGNPGIRQEDSEGQIAVVDEQKATVNGQKLLALSHCTKDSTETCELTENLSGNVLGNPGIRQEDSEGQIAVVDEQKATVNGQKLLALSHCTKDSTETCELTENLSGNVLGNPGIRQEDSERKIAVVDEQKATVNSQKLLALSHCTKDSTETCELTENISGNVLGNHGIRQEDSEGKIAVIDEQKATFNGQQLLALSHCTKDSTETRELTGNLSGNILGHPEILQEDSEEQVAVVDEQKATVNGHKLLALSHCTKDSTETCELTDNLSVDSKVRVCDPAEKSRENTPACVLLNVDGVQTIESQAEICVSGFSEHPVVIRETEAKNKSYFDDQNTLPVMNPRKDGNGTCEMTKRISIDSMAMDCSPSKDIAENDISSPALLKSDKTKSVRPTLTSGFAENSVSSTDNAQNLHESLLDTFNEVNGNNDAAEMGSYTYSGPIPLSGPISYSGPIPFSGSLSLRSDSSTTSTRSFAFPILSSEWNSSPVKMVQADPRYFRKKRRWRFLCFCARESSFR